MNRILDGHDLTYSQMNGLACFSGGPGRAMRVGNKALREAGLSDDEVKDLVSKGYLEPLTDGDYLMPGDVDGDAIARRLREQSNREIIRQMKSGMF